jgi:hypothetical protein
MSPSPNTNNNNNKNNNNNNNNNNVDNVDNDTHCDNETISRNITSDSKLYPFEWLTSSESILPIIESLLSSSTTSSTSTSTSTSTTTSTSSSSLVVHDNSLSRTALHLGCGTSILGELLVTKLNFTHVLNIDREEKALEFMRQRWKTTIVSQNNNKDNHNNNNNNNNNEDNNNHHHLGTLEYRQLDIHNWRELYDDNDDNSAIPKFSFVLDKGTLDAILCGHDGNNDDKESLDTTILEFFSCINHSLGPGGWYIVVSLYPWEFLQSLLLSSLSSFWYNDLGSEPWTVVQHVSTTKDNVRIVSCHKPPHSSHDDNNAPRLPPPPSSSPCEEIRTQIIQTIMDTWFQTKQPFLTQQRQHELELAFGGHEDEKKEEKSLYECYSLFFTPEERHAYLQEKSSMTISSTSMNLKTALDFLQRMQ